MGLTGKDFSSLRKNTNDTPNVVDLTQFRQTKADEPYLSSANCKLQLLCVDGAFVVKRAQSGSTFQTVSRVVLGEIKHIQLTVSTRPNRVVALVKGPNWELAATGGVAKSRLEKICIKNGVKIVMEGPMVPVSAAAPSNGKFGSASAHQNYGGLVRVPPKRSAASVVDDMFDSPKRPDRSVVPRTQFQQKQQNSTEWNASAASGSNSTLSSSPTRPASASSPVKFAPSAAKRQPRSVLLSSSIASKTPIRGILKTPNGAPKLNGSLNDAPLSPTRRRASPQTSPDHYPDLGPKHTLDSIPSTPPSPEKTESGTVSLLTPTPRKSARVAALDMPSGAYTEESLLEPTPAFVQKLRTEGYYDLRHEFSDGKFYNLTVQDMARLEENVYLDDSLVMFLLKYFYDTALPEEYKSKTHVFSTFFFPSVEHKPQESVAKWTAKLDMAKQLIIIPIHQKFHWSVLVVANLDKWIMTGTEYPSLVLFDSMRSTDQVRGQLFRSITHILTAVLESKHLKPFTRNQVKRISAKVPKQNNSSDCGVFLVNFMSHLFAQPDRFLEGIAEATPKSPFAFGSFEKQEEYGRPQLLTLLREVCECGQPQEKIAESEESDLEMFET